MAHKAYSPRIPAEEDPKDAIDNEGVFEEDDAASYNARGGNNDEYAEGPEGTLRRPVGGVGQGPPIPLRASSTRMSSPSNNRSSGYYQSERMV